uniref:Uncharacterized protein n=1 Tax=Arundo donax TaxID=35708 RepID=A0A0A9C996_ARUDO
MLVKDHKEIVLIIRCRHGYLSPYLWGRQDTNPFILIKFPFFDDGKEKTNEGQIRFLI